MSSGAQRKARAGPGISGSEAGAKKGNLYATAAPLDSMKIFTNTNYQKETHGFSRLLRAPTHPGNHKPAAQILLNSNTVTNLYGSQHWASPN